MGRVATIYTCKMARVLSIDDAFLKRPNVIFRSIPRSPALNRLSPPSPAIARLCPPLNAFARSPSLKSQRNFATFISAIFRDENFGLGFRSESCF